MKDVINNIDLILMITGACLFVFYCLIALCTGHENDLIGIAQEIRIVCIAIGFMVVGISIMHLKQFYRKGR